MGDVMTIAVTDADGKPMQIAVEDMRNVRDAAETMRDAVDRALGREVNDD